MEVVFECSHCHATIEAHSDISGVRAECPNCSEVVLVPAPGIEMGMEVGGFKIEKKLGVGGMGEVFMATQIAMDRKVALKILPPALTGDEKTVERFLHEVRMAAKLEHPNIVTSFDAGKASGYHYLAMSFVDGEDLSGILKRDKRLTEDTALAIVDKVAHALDYAWTKFQLLHRDVKPANIMITSENEVKLMDMGIAKSLEEDSNLTMQGMLVGTPYYMSPEQATGSQDIDCRSDIYSLGATFYHLVTGKRPFNGPNAMAVIAKHMSETPPPPQSINSELSDGCSALIFKMMARDRADRFNTWQDLRRAVAKVRSGQTVADVEAPTQISGGMIAPAPHLSAMGDDTALNLGMDDTIGLKGTEHTVSKAPPRLATTMEMPGSRPQTATPAGAIGQNMPPASDTGEPILEGGRDAMDVKGVRTGVFMAAAIGVLMIAILVFVIFWISRKVANEDAAVTIAKKEQSLETKKAEGEIDTNIARVTELKDDRKALEKMTKIARAYVRDNPGDLDGGISKFEDIRSYAEKLDLKEYVMEAESEIERMKKARATKSAAQNEAEAKRVMERLVREAKEQAEKYLYAPAAYTLAIYDGPMASETKSERTALARKLLAKQAEIAPMVTFMRQALHLYADDNKPELQRLLDKGRHLSYWKVDKRLFDENIMPLMPILDERARFDDKRPPNDRRFDRNPPDRPKRPFRRPNGKIPGGLLGKAVHLYKQKKYPLALGLVRQAPVTLFRQVLMGEVLAAILKGSWTSKRFGGKGYRDQVKKMEFVFDGTQAQTFYDDKKRGEGKLELFGNWMYYDRSDGAKYWAVSHGGQGTLVINILPDVSATLTQKP